MKDHSEDLFANTRMSFGDHIEDLRVHLIRALAGFVIALCLSFVIGRPVERFIASPVETQLMEFYNRRVKEAETKLEEEDPTLTKANEPREMEITMNRKQLTQALGLQDQGLADDETFNLTITIKPVSLATIMARANQLVGRPPTLVALSITEGFTVYMKVCVYCGIVLASPWLFFQIWSFVAAGLYPHEKRHVNLYLPISLGLFLAGVALCEFVVIPKAVAYLLAFNEWMGLESDLRLSEWLSFATLMPLVFGIAFQTPLVMLFLERLGIMSVDAYRKHRRIAIFVMAVLAAIIAPSPDILSIMSLTVPLWCLYELGILMCIFSPRPGMGLDVPESEEMVEV
jgi:sec-independent protein translocase protein TatC